VRITSTRNPLIRLARSLDRPTARREHGLYLVEGVRLTSEAVQTRQRARLSFYDPESLGRTAAGMRLLGCLSDWTDEAHEVSASALDAVAQTETPSGVVAILELPAPGPLASHSRDRLGLVLDRLGDPGNVGTILRTADALGLSYVVALDGSADLFAPKVVRAAMGAHFRLELYQHMLWKDVEAQLPGVSVVAAVPAGGDPLPDFVWPERALLVVGSEASGLSPEVESSVERRVRVPLRPGVESLNAAVAAAVTMYAALAQSPSPAQSVTDERV
jgi:TrmH family RNA methyltransferase